MQISANFNINVKVDHGADTGTSACTNELSWRKIPLRFSGEILFSQSSHLFNFEGHNQDSSVLGFNKC